MGNWQRYRLVVRTFILVVVSQRYFSIPITRPWRRHEEMRNCKIPIIFTVILLPHFFRFFSVHFLLMSLLFNLLFIIRCRRNHSPRWIFARKKRLSTRTPRWRWRWSPDLIVLLIRCKRRRQLTMKLMGTILRTLNLNLLLLTTCQRFFMFFVSLVFYTNRRRGKERKQDQ
jgi:hypothetical protein